MTDPDHEAAGGGIRGQGNRCPSGDLQTPCSSADGDVWLNNYKNDMVKCLYQPVVGVVHKMFCMGMLTYGDITPKLHLTLQCP